MNTPAAYLIDRARLVALKSSCSKSRRGAIVFDRELEERRFARTVDGSLADPDTFSSVANLIVIGEGYNHIALGACSGTETCRADCNKLCVHAEAMAIRDALMSLSPTPAVLRSCDVLHVKLKVNVVAAGGPPSCWQCSKEILDAGLRGVWLFEGCDCANVERLVTDKRKHADMCPFNYTTDVGRGSGLWRYYTARDFHVETLRNCGMADRV